METLLFIGCIIFFLFGIESFYSYSRCLLKIENLEYENKELRRKINQLEKDNYFKGN